MNKTNILSVYEAAELLGLSKQYIRRLLKQKKLTGIRVGKTWIIPIETINKYKEMRKDHITVNDQVSKIKIDQSKKMNVLSFFSGAMGLDIGLHNTGMNTLLTCEIDKASRKTIVTNNPEIGLIGDLRNYSTEEILHHAGLTDAKDVDVIVGGPPCQAFSTAGKRKGFQDERGNVFLKFIEVIEDIKPQYAVIENVRGLLSSIYSIDLPEDEKELLPEAIKGKKGSTLYYVLNRLEKAGYKVSFNLYNSANYGTPQKRERVIIICTLGETKVPYLKPTNSQKGDYDLPLWNTLEDALKGLPEFPKDHIEFPEKRLKYYRLLGPGENWRNLSEENQKAAMGKSYYLGGGKTGFFRRLAWDKPSPTIVTNPAMPATDLAHPEENRPLSVQEYKRIQEFPDNWNICGSILNQYKQIGNAVPVSIGEAIGKAIINHSKGREHKDFTGFPYSRYKKTSEIEFMENLNKELKKEKLAPQLELGFV